MSDPFDTHGDSITSPARCAQAIVPSDQAALPVVPKAIYIGAAGTLTMRGIGDAADSVWRNVAAGTILPFRASHVRVTGTTATDLLALY